MVRITLELPDDVVRITYERQPEGQAYTSDQIAVSIGQIVQCDRFEEANDAQKGSDEEANDAQKGSD